MDSSCGSQEWMGLKKQLPLSRRDGPTSSHRLTGEDEELGREGWVKILLLTLSRLEPHLSQTLQLHDAKVKTRSIYFPTSCHFLNDLGEAELLDLAGKFSFAELFSKSGHLLTSSLPFFPLILFRFFPFPFTLFLYPNSAFPPPLFYIWILLQLYSFFIEKLDFFAALITSFFFIIWPLSSLQ